ncbi:MAG: 50S ribosomal protein L31e [Nitrososphaerota archaeon]
MSDEKEDKPFEGEIEIRKEAPETKAAKEAEEAEEKPKVEKRREEEDIVEERVYTVPFGRVWLVPRKRRSPKAMRVLKGFIQKHMKIADDSLVISNEVNERIWSRGIEKPPRKIRIRAVKNKEGIVTVHLAEGG